MGRLCNGARGRCPSGCRQTDGRTSSPGCHRAGRGWLGSAWPPACPQPCRVPPSPAWPPAPRPLPSNGAGLVGSSPTGMATGHEASRPGLARGAGVLESTRSLMRRQERIKNLSHATFWQAVHVGVPCAEGVSACCLCPKSFELGERQQRSRGAPFPPVFTVCGGVSEPPAGVGARLHTALQNEMKQVRVAPLQGSALGLKQRGQSGRKKREDAPRPQQKHVLNVNLIPLNYTN